MQQPSVISKAEDKYSIFDYMLEGVQVIGRDWRYLYLNSAAASQGQASKENLLGYTMMEKYPGIENTSLFTHIRRSMEERTRYTLLNEFKFPNGSTGYFDLRITPVEEGILIMSSDITRQTQMEIELRGLNEELEKRVAKRTVELQASLTREKELSEMKSRFVSMASHEFRTPLSTVLSSVNLIEHYLERGEYDKEGKHIERIKSSVKNLIGILNNFLSLEKIESGKTEIEPELFDLDQLLQETIEEVSGMLKAGQAINYSYQGGSDAFLDKKVLHNIVLNLLSNAIKYSQQDIDLLVDAGPVAFTIQVADRGIGISDEEQKKLFSQFFRARNAANIQGTGLGLNIVKQYVDLLGGSISFISRQNEGTTFTVSLPNRSSA